MISHEEAHELHDIIERLHNNLGDAPLRDTADMLDRALALSRDVLHATAPGPSPEPDVTYGVMWTGCEPTPIHPNTEKAARDCSAAENRMMRRELGPAVASRPENTSYPVRKVGDAQWEVLT